MLLAWACIDRWWKDSRCCVAIELCLCIARGLRGCEQSATSAQRRRPQGERRIPDICTRRRGLRCASCSTLPPPRPACRRRAERTDDRRRVEGLAQAVGDRVAVGAGRTSAECADDRTDNGPGGAWCKKLQRPATSPEWRGTALRDLPAESGGVYAIGRAPSPYGDSPRPAGRAEPSRGGTGSTRRG